MYVSVGWTITNPQTLTHTHTDTVTVERQYILFSYTTSTLDAYNYLQVSSDDSRKILAVFFSLIQNILIKYAKTMDKKGESLPQTIL